MTDIKKGDRVRVVIEGVVSSVSSVGLDLHDGYTFVNTKQEGVTVEKIEPPVEVFKPGDVVRQKHGSRGVYFIRPNGGFTNLSQTGEEWDHKFEFTSEFYERVDLE